jgi:hypothetical protein
VSRFFTTAYLAKRLGMTVEEAWDFYEGWRLERPDVIERRGRSWWGITDEVLGRDAPAISLLPEHDPRPRCLNCFEVLPEAANGRRRKYCPGGRCKQRAYRQRNGQRKRASNNQVVTR